MTCIKPLDGLFEQLCTSCIAEFNGGFPNFNVEELKNTWKGEGYCLRCVTKLKKVIKENINVTVVKNGNIITL